MNQAVSFVPPAPKEQRRRARTGAGVSFRAFIAYADVAAAGGVMNAINDVFRVSPRPHALNPRLWHFNQLVAAQWRESALQDAADAEIIIFASTPSARFPVALEAWTAAVLERRHGRATTLVSLLGPSDTWSVTLEPPRPVATAPLASAPWPTAV